MFLNPKYGTFGFITMPYFILYEVLGPFFEFASISLIIWAAFQRLLDVRLFLGVFAFMAITQALISNIVLFVFVRNFRIFRPAYVFYLATLGIFELFLYRWIIIISKVRGTIKTLLGVKTFDQYKRK